jgi:AcrR family transcriptional regulator
MRRIPPFGKHSTQQIPMPRSNPAQLHGSAADETPARSPVKAPRALRADAQRNYDLLVAAADAAFTEHGADASLDDIARRAGVGIGTLYRHFPTREALLAAVLNEGATAIVDRAHELMTARSPIVGLSAWLDALVGYVMMYRGLGDTLAAAFNATGQPLCRSCDAIAAAGTALVKRAQDAGELSPDAVAADLVMTAHAAAWISEQTKDPDAPGRMLATMLAGLRATGKPAPAPTSKSVSRRSRS